MKFYSSNKKIQLFILFFFLSCSIYAQEKYLNHEYSYSLTIPKEWAKIPSSEVNQLASLSINAKYDAGFYPIGNKGGDWGYPYILLSFFPVDITEIPFEKAANDLTQSLRLKPLKEYIDNTSVEKILQLLEVGEYYYDKNERKLFMNATAYVKGYGKISGINVMHFSKRGVLTINCYEKEGQGFSSLFDSVIFSSTIK